MKRNDPKLFALTAIVAFLFPDCASIVSRSSYPVSIDTNPQGAAVTITNKKDREIYVGKTPSTVQLKAGAGYFSPAHYKVKLSLPGYADRVVPVEFKLNGWYFGNLLIGWGLGLLIIDPLTGAMWRMDSPRTINVALDKSTTSVQEPALKILDIKDVPLNMKGRMVRIK